MRRRTFLSGIAGAGVVYALPTGLWGRNAFAAVDNGPYGPLGPPDGNGLRLPEGFRSRVIGVTGQRVSGTDFVWHGAPDGGGCVATADGGWVYVSNAELGDDRGGASAIRFDADGQIAGAYSILDGTSRNCAGGMTPWGTWLSCEERGSRGEVWECDPQRPSQGIVRPLLGHFNHEAAAVDPVTGDVYLTEDHPQGRLYRFVPDTPGDLSAGSLFAANVKPIPGDRSGGGAVTWVPTSPDRPDRQSSTASFRGGEGIYFGDGVLYFTTKIDKRVWELDMRTSTVAVAYDCNRAPEGSLDAVDNLIVHGPTGYVFVAEDGGNMELGVMSGPTGARTTGPMLRLEGHSGSEIAGPAFSPDGRRLYVSSQRGSDGSTGVTYEITGPFVGDVPAQPVTAVVTQTAHVRGGEYANANFRGADLEVGSGANENYTRHALLAVPVPAALGPFARATLRVHAKVWRGAASSIGVVPVADGWSARDVTWNTRPGMLGGPVGEAAVSTTSSPVELDVTAQVNAAHAAGRGFASVALVQTERLGELCYVSGGSSATPPEVEVVPGEPPAAPGGRSVVPAASDTWVRGGSFAATNFGDEQLLEVVNNSNDEYTRWAYLCFEVPTVVAAGSAVLRFAARVWDGSSSTLVVHPVAAGWRSDQMVWDSRPIPNDGDGRTVDVVDGESRFYEVDVTDWARAVTPGERLAVVIRQVERNGPVVYVNPSNHWTDDTPELIIAP